ncbi:MAG: rhodanese-like domain-containing protein [Fidelibacterota bacterium]
MKIVISFAIIGWLLLSGFQTEKAEYKLSVDGDFNNITVKKLQQRLASGDTLILLDVRTLPEYNGPLGHIEDSILIPVQELESRIEELEKYKDQEIIVICRSGNRSRVGSEILSRNGYQATNLLGGMKAWNQLISTGNN